MYITLSEYKPTDESFMIKISRRDEIFCMIEEDEKLVKVRGSPHLEKPLFIPVKNPHGTQKIYIFTNNYFVYIKETREDKSNTIFIKRDIVQWDYTTSSKKNFRWEEEIKEKKNGYIDVIKLSNNGSKVIVKIDLTYAQFSNLDEALNSLNISQHFDKNICSSWIPNPTMFFTQKVNIEAEGDIELVDSLWRLDAFGTNPLDPLLTGRIHDKLTYKAMLVAYIPEDKRAKEQKWFKSYFIYHNEKLIGKIIFKEHGMYYHEKGFYYHNNIEIMPL